MPLNRTPLYETHAAAGAKLVDFGGWEMPLNYGSQIEEHHAVRRDAGMFDVSHMRPVDVEGADAREFLRVLIANNVDKLTHLASTVFVHAERGRRCGRRPDCLFHTRRCISRRRQRIDCGQGRHVDAPSRGHSRFQGAPYASYDLAIIAVQGPNARTKFWQARPVARAVTRSLLRFSRPRSTTCSWRAPGYTGEDGFEVILPAHQASQLWDDLKAAGVAEAGLGARDTLRLEAGMNRTATIWTKGCHRSMPASLGLSI